MIAHASKRNQPRYRWRTICGAGLVLTFLHIWVLHRFDVGDFTPDLFTLVAIYMGLYASREGRYAPNLVLGLIRDLFSIGLLGTYAVLYSLLYKVMTVGRRRMDPDKPVNTLVLAWLGVFFVNFGYHFVLVLLGSGVGWTRAGLRCACIATATAPIAVFLFPLLHYGLYKAKFNRLPGGYWNI